MGFCQNIVRDLVNEALGKDENASPQLGPRDIHKDKFINIEFEHWKRLIPEPASPKKERNKSGRPHPQGQVEVKEAVSKTEAHKTIQRTQDLSKDKRTYNIFHTDMKKDKNKDTDYFGHFNSTNPAKRLAGKIDRKDGSVFTDMENNINLRVHENEGTNSENPSKNSASLQSSPENPHYKKLELLYQEVPQESLQYPSLTSPLNFRNISPNRQAEFFASTAHKIQPQLYHAPNGHTLISYLQQEKKSSYPPGLDYSLEPPLLKAIVSISSRRVPELS